MDNIQIIKDYIIFLKTNHKLSITLHPIKPEDVISASELISFNIHDNSYCVYLKSCSEARKHCIKRQGRVLDKCTSPFEGVCYAGVKEFVYPIFNGREVIGFISVSGYKTDNYNSYIEKVSREYSLNYSTLKEIYASLKNEIPPKEYVDTLILPLCKMLELAYIKTEKIPKSNETLAQKIKRYLKLHRNENITSKDICRALLCSRSYMSTEFNKHTGMSIREYINKLRIEDAKLLLTNSDLTITEIAFSVGFSDSNYFSNVFKSIVGVSPIKYRKGY